MLLGTLQSASVDVRDVNIRFGASMEEIAAAWATGRADAVWCADACVLYVQRTPHPADDAPEVGGGTDTNVRVFYDSSSEL